MKVQLQVSRDKIHLTTPRRKRSGVLAAHPEQNQLGDVPEIEPDAATIGAAIFPDFMPNDVRLVSKGSYMPSSYGTTPIRINGRPGRPVLHGSSCRVPPRNNQRQMTFPAAIFSWAEFQLPHQ
jgi:hypothetical protein